MPRGGWRLYAAVGAAIGLVISIWIVVDYRKGQASERQEATSYNQEDAESSREECVGITGTRQLICLIQATKTTQQEKRSEYDLQAQQDMSAWALGLLIAGVWGLAMSGVGLWALFRTLRETRNMTIATQTVGERSTKAYLSVEKCAVIWPQDREPHQAVFTFKNSGQTPALNIRVAVHEIGKHERSTQWHLANRHPFGAVPGNDSINFAFTMSSDATNYMLVSWEDGASIGPAIIGTVFYEDIYGRLYRSNFYFLLKCTAGGGGDPRRDIQSHFPPFGTADLLYEEAPEEYQPNPRPQ